MLRVFFKFEACLKKSNILIHNWAVSCIFSLKMYSINRLNWWQYYHVLSTTAETFFARIPILIIKIKLTVFSFVCSGKNVLNQKSELQRALEKQKDNLAKKELQTHVAEKTPELEKVIADRARRLQEGTNDNKVIKSKVKNKYVLQLLSFWKTRKYEFWKCTYI